MAFVDIHGSYWLCFRNCQPILLPLFCHGYEQKADLLWPMLAICAG
jgi:hypothetical protein